MGAIAAFMPIAVSIATHLALNPSLMAATVVCGAMFGDNLSILSDTTIAAVKVTNTTMTKKLILNSKIALPAFIGSILLLTYKNYSMVHAIDLTYIPTISFLDMIKTLPYVATFYLALTGLDIIIVLVLGIIFALSIGLLLQNITTLMAINILFDGFYNSKGMVNVFILVLLLSGLSSIITYNGGIEYLINKIKHKISSPRYAKLAILLLIVLINITIAINTIAIIIAGPIAVEIGEDYEIDNAETACILDIGSCTIQGLLPYTPQLLLAASMAQVSTISLLPYLYYQFFLGISLLLTITWRKNKPIRK
jgi:Na+/H+ antiporter NhaC